MHAFHHDPAIKALYLARVRAHRAADEIVHGQYWDTGKGCAVGCTLHGSNHAAYETELGIPRLLARLEDGIFEALDPPDDALWPEQFLEAIPVGADLSLVWPHFAVQLLSDPTHGVLPWVQTASTRRQKEAIQSVIDYFKQWCDTGIKPAAAAAADAAVAAAAAAANAAAAAANAAAAAYAAVAAAAYAAADAAAAIAAAAADAAVAAAAAAATAVAAAAANAAAAAATDAAYAANAAAAAAAAAATTDARQWQAQTLLQLLAAAPVPVTA